MPSPLHAHLIPVLQPLFDQVVHHLLAQNEQSAKDRGAEDIGTAPTCLYRGPRGLRCAVGAIISDAAYSPKMEGMPPAKLLVHYPNAIPTLTPFIPTREDWENSYAGPDFTDITHFLWHLQDIHDRNPSSEWPRLLRSAATTLGLTFPGDPAP